VQAVRTNRLWAPAAAGAPIRPVGGMARSRPTGARPDLELRDTWTGRSPAEG